MPENPYSSVTDPRIFPTPEGRMEMVLLLQAFGKGIQKTPVQ